MNFFRFKKRETIKQNKFNRLELFYMMNVALYLENKYDAFNFIQINKKCEQTLTALKSTPFPFDSISTEWFSHHFNPDTIDRKYKYSSVEECDRKAKIIRRPGYRIENNENEIVELFPRITSLSLFLKTVEEKINFKDLIYQHIEKLTNLKRVVGSLMELIKFFKTYTKEGKEMNVPFPEKIVVDEYDNNFDKRMKINENLIIQMRELKKYIRKESDTKIICYLDDFVDDNGEELLKSEDLSNIYWIYSHFLSFDPNKNIISKMRRNELLTFQNYFGNNDMNDIIEKYYPSTIFLFDENSEIGNNFLEEKEIWRLPECVKTLKMMAILFDVESLEGKDEIESEEIKKMIEDGKYKLFIDMSTIEILYIYFCHNLRFNHSFDVLKEIHLKRSYETYFEEIDGKSIKFPQLETIFLYESFKIHLNIDAPKLNYIHLMYCNEIEIRGNIDSIKRLEIISSNVVTFEWMDISKKDVKIQYSGNIKFMKGNDDVLPFSPGLMSLNNFQNFCYYRIEFSNESVEYGLLSNKYIPFHNDMYNITKCDDIDNQVVERSYFDECFKKEYYLESNQECDHTKSRIIMTREGKKLIPFDIVYFEVKLFGYTDIEIGIKKNVELCAFNNHYTTKKYILYSFLSGDIIINQKCQATRSNHNLYSDCVIGCGYDHRNKKVFFTKNGLKIWETNSIEEIEITENSYILFIHMNYFNKIEINTGSKEFMFDLIQEYSDKKKKQNKISNKF